MSCKIWRVDFAFCIPQRRQIVQNVSAKLISFSVWFIFSLLVFPLLHYSFTSYCVTCFSNDDWQSTFIILAIRAYAACAWIMCLPKYFPVLLSSISIIKLLFSLLTKRKAIYEAHTVNSHNLETVKPHCLRHSFFIALWKHMHLLTNQNRAIQIIAVHEHAVANEQRN